MLRIQNLHASVEGGTEILKGLSLEVPAGEVHAIMGPNGAGKSTLGYTLAGREGYEVTEGSAHLGETSLFELEADERAREGLFLAFQYPVEIPGVGNAFFLRTAVNAVRVHRGLEPLDAPSFMRRVRKTLPMVGLPVSMLRRSVNDGFSGGEKKRNEVLQMALLEPRLCVLDETDSGLDIDALRTVAEGVNAMRHPERSFLIITHYQRLLDYIKPDKVHIMVDGRIVHSGGPELALRLEAEGYGWLTAEQSGGQG